MLQEKPAARRESRHRARDDAAQVLKTVDAVGEGACGLEFEREEVLVLRVDVGGIRDDEVEGFTLGNRLEPFALERADVGAQRRCVLLCHSERLGTLVRGGDARAGNFERQRHGDAAAPGTEVEHLRCGAGDEERLFDQHLGVGAGDQDAVVHREPTPEELLPAGEVGHRGARRAHRDDELERGRLFGRQHLVVVGDQVFARLPEDVREENVRFKAADLGGRVREVLGDGLGFVGGGRRHGRKKRSKSGRVVRR